MMRPRPCARIAGSTALHVWTAPMKFVANCASMRSSGMSSIEPTPEKPALFTRTSMRPKRSTAAPPRVGTTEPLREKAVGESRREIVQRGGVSGRGDDIVACRQRGLHDRTSQADRTACDEPSIVHIYPPVPMSNPSRIAILCGVARRHVVDTG